MLVQNNTNQHSLPVVDDNGAVTKTPLRSVDKALSGYETRVEEAGLASQRLLGLGFRELDAVLAGRAKVRDEHFDAIAKAQYWAGHAYLVYRGVADDRPGEVGQYKPCIGTRLVQRGLNRIANNIHHTGREIEKFRPLAEIDRSAITDDQIYELTKYEMPFVVRNCVSDWPAVKQFTPQFFKDRFADVEIPINKGEKRPDTDKSKPTDYRQYYTIRYDTVGNLVDSILSGGSLQALSVEDLLHRDDDYLLKNFIKMEQIERWSGYHRGDKALLNALVHTGKIASVQLFMASGTGYTTWHCAPADNFFLQVCGAKYWTFADTKYTVGMSPVIKRSQVYQGSRVDARESDEDSISRGFRLYPYVPKYHATLYPGDMLYNPEYTWHSVRTAGTEPTIGLGVRTGGKASLRSPVYQMLRLFDSDSWTIIKSALSSGRLKDDDLVGRIFEYVDPANRLRSANART